MRRSRNADESRAETSTEQRREQSRNASRDERRREKPAVFRATTVKCASRNSLKRSALSARGNDCHANWSGSRTRLHMARAREHRTRCTASVRRVTKGAYTETDNKFVSSSEAIINFFAKTRYTTHVSQNTHNSVVVSS